MITSARRKLQPGGSARWDSTGRADLATASAGKPAPFKNFGDIRDESTSSNYIGCLTTFKFLEA
jgi:hypothetical protein